MRAFLTPKTSLGDLDAASAAALIAAAADIALVIDAGGVIRDLALHSDDLSADLPDSEHWLGKALVETVAPDSRAKVEALVRDAAAGAPPRWRHINHAGAGNTSVPVLYSAALLGDDGRVVAFGRDLRGVQVLQQRLMNAQQSMERDYSRLREIEMRYRLLFQMSSEPVLIVDSARQKVTEANPAAMQVVGGGGALVGRALDEIFRADTLAAVQAHLGAVRGGARSDQVAAVLTDGDVDVGVAASLFRQESATLYLIRITPASGQPAMPASETRANLLKVVDSAPDAFVMTDRDGHIVTTNAAFLELAQLHGDEQAEGEPLDRWIGQSPVDLNVLIANLRQRGAIRFFATTMRGELGASTQVEISAAAIGQNETTCFGFAIRNVGPRLRVDLRTTRELPRSVEQLTELIGRVALKDLVREATDVIERLCIEAALELTGDNRASAAEMLGLSRQSLYVKLRRYGLGDLAGDDGN